jgi:hypothetical protein
VTGENLPPRSECVRAPAGEHDGGMRLNHVVALTVGDRVELYAF